MLCLPDGFARLDTEFLCQLVFGEDDAVSRLGIARDRDGMRPERGVEKARHRGIETVEIRVENSASHWRSLSAALPRRGLSLESELMFVSIV